MYTKTIRNCFLSLFKIRRFPTEKTAAMVLQCNSAWLKSWDFDTLKSPASERNNTVTNEPLMHPWVINSFSRRYYTPVSKVPFLQITMLVAESLEWSRNLLLSFSHIQGINVLQWNLIWQFRSGLGNTFRKSFFTVETYQQFIRGFESFLCFRNLFWSNCLVGKRNKNNILFIRKKLW